MIRLIRCDDRLIHGQCMTKIVQEYFIKCIIVVDDFTATNSVMKLVFEKAVPPSMKANVYTVLESYEPIRKAVSDSQNTLVLFRSPVIYKSLMENVDDLPKIMNIGPVAKKPGAQEVNTGTYLSKEDICAIESLVQNDVDVFFQIVPGEKKLSWDDVKKKLK